MPTSHWIKPTGDDGLIGRAHMPQIDDADIPTLLAYLGAQSIQFSAGMIDPKTVHSHQPIDVDRAKAMLSKWLKTPSIISNEPIVIDGNHRWYRHLVDGSMMPFIRVETNFNAAMALILKFPATYEDAT